MTSVRVLTNIALHTVLIALMTGSIVFAQEAVGTLELDTAQFALKRIAPGQTRAEASFLIEPSGRVSVEIISDVAALETSVTLPSGLTITALNVESLGGEYVVLNSQAVRDTPLLLGSFTGSVHYLYRFPALESGTYVVRGALSPDTMPHFLAAEVRTDGVAGAKLFATETTSVVGHPTVLGLALFEGSEPVTGATVTVQVRAPAGGLTTLTLLDGGADPDAQAGDGLYSGELSPASAGQYSLLADVTGTLSSGAPFKRHSATQLRAVPPSTVVAGGVQDRGVDDNGDGLFERVVVRFLADTVLEGNYLAHVLLKTASGVRLVGTTTAALIVGSAPVEVPFPASLFLDAGEPGPYQIELIELLKLDANGASTPADKQADVGQTQPYALSDFTRPSLALTGVINDQAFDDNGNGRFDRLVIGIQVNVQQAGFYTWSLKLAGRSSRELAFGSGSGQLSVGPNNLAVTFAGTAIGNSGVDGPYTLRDLLLAGPSASLIAADVGRTKSYAATQFERTVSPADLNDDRALTAVDFTLFRNAMSSCFGQPRYLLRADYDDDGCITLVDYQKFLLYYNQR